MEPSMFLRAERTIQYANLSGAPDNRIRPHSFAIGFRQTLFLAQFAVCLYRSCVDLILAGSIGAEQYPSRSLTFTRDCAADDVLVRPRDRDRLTPFPVLVALREHLVAELRIVVCPEVLGLLLQVGRFDPAGFVLEVIADPSDP